VHLPLVAAYAAAGGAMGAAWSARVGRRGAWGLRLIAATPVSFTLVALRHGPLTGWPPRARLWLPLVIPAFAWVLGSSRRRT